MNYKATTFRMKANYLKYDGNILLSQSLSRHLIRNYTFAHEIYKEIHQGCE